MTRVSGRQLAVPGWLNLVPGAPGFVSAYWLAPIDGVGIFVIVFETEEPGEQAVACPLPSRPGVPPLAVEICEVYARAELRSWLSGIGRGGNLAGPV